MAFQTVFKRYELKYLLNLAQKDALVQAMAPHMALDKYGRTTIRNIYFDTDDYRLIRRSIEKPAYKEKLRLRSYAQATQDSPVFVELKKKYNQVVYKRRLALTQREAMDWLCREAKPSADTQISREIQYFMDLYGPLKPTVFLSYDREAYYEKNGGDFRVTFDHNLLCRRTNIDLCSPAYGTPILPQDRVLLELKCSGGIPLWMVEVLSREKIYKTAFSKYGTAYELQIFPKQKETMIYGCDF